VIVVVGSPHLRFRESKQEAAGPTVGVAAAAAAAGADVQLVGKIGDDPAGEVVLLDLAGRGIGHVAVLRDPTRATPETADADSADPAEAEPFVDPSDIPEPRTTAEGPTLEPADIELALRYLPDYRVLVVAEPLLPEALHVVVAASRWSGAALILVVPRGSEPLDLPDATVLEAPADDPDDAFASVVGGYSAALDRGEEPAEAFASASTASGWAAVPAD
jgi:pfkB family carbohydrate kinase